MLFSDSRFPILFCFLISSVLFSDSDSLILSGRFPTSLPDFDRCFPISSSLAVSACHAVTLTQRVSENVAGALSVPSAATLASESQRALNTSVRCPKARLAKTPFRICWASSKDRSLLGKTQPSEGRRRRAATKEVPKGERG